MLPARHRAAALLLRCAVIAVCAVVLASCASSRCGYCERGECDDPSTLLWNVELSGRIPDPCGGPGVQSFATSVPPMRLVRSGRDTVYRVELPCPTGDGCERRRVDLPASSVLRITTPSDPRLPPRVIDPASPCINCDRVRDGLLVFDKLELRAMGGWRGEQTAVFYPDATGGMLYEPSTFGFDRGGTTITVGGEVAALWDVLRVGERHMLHVGPLTGIWPVDGSTFIPVSLHPRLTFNNQVDPYGCNCDAWYLFGDAGLAFDGSSGAPVDPLFEKRFFYGVGVGYEWALHRSLDAALDIFYRRTRLPLPPVDCCPDIPDDQRNPVRASHVFGLRLGITF